MAITQNEMHLQMSFWGSRNRKCQNASTKMCAKTFMRYVPSHLWILPLHAVVVFAVVLAAVVAAAAVGVQAALLAALEVVIPRIYTKLVFKAPRQLTLVYFVCKHIYWNGFSGLCSAQTRK